MYSACQKRRDFPEGFFFFSSDVCSSDLGCPERGTVLDAEEVRREDGALLFGTLCGMRCLQDMRKSELYFEN